MHNRFVRGLVKLAASEEVPARGAQDLLVAAVLREAPLDSSHLCFL
jgi:hypothetical protein